MRKYKLKNSPKIVKFKQFYNVVNNTYHKLKELTDR